MSAPRIREAIDKLASVFSANPGKARVKNAAATARLDDGLKCEVTGPNGERVLTDMPPGVGGEGTAPNPSWLLRSGMASCTATVIAMRAARLGIELKTLEVTVESESDQRGMLGLDDGVSAGLGGLRMKVRIAGNAPAAKLKELVEWSEAHSPVSCTVRNAPASALEVEVA
jgi:uncharacterized OsmC-like protein